VKISTEEVDRIRRTPYAGTAVRDREQSAAPAEDEVERVAELVAGAPDTRDELVESIKARIEAGTYHVSSEEVADLMVRRAFADRIR